MIETLRQMAAMGASGCLVWFFVQDIPTFTWIEMWLGYAAFFLIGLVSVFVRSWMVYLSRCKSALSQLGNTILGPLFNVGLIMEAWLTGKSWKGLWHRHGFPDETLSSVFHKNREVSWIASSFAVTLDWIDPGHGERAVEPDEGRKFRKE